MGKLNDYYQRQQPSGNPSGTVAEPPKVDKDNVLGSLSGMLGPTPAERAAEEERLQRHRKQMHGWTALFNGLRHLGNLYYATKGAPGQKYGEPHQQIEQRYQDERKRLADIHAADRSYYSSLYNIRRQMEDDERKNKLSDAQLKHYQTQDEMDRLKAENDRLKAEAAARNSNAKAETEEYLRAKKGAELDTRVQKNRAQAAKTGQTGSKRSNTSGSSSKGSKKKETKQTSSTKTYDNTKKLGL